ncbi:C45 family autoproteolytic acyltransferase/hydolase [Nocardia alni]|uniref:C45 family autoproteolytic acyltransferase/hydolase n=1 Tax=Nocardia alni TaxID=2815723 RepID=UPI001C225018|nr:C45 family peptidase [Nocardia alni]
MTVVECAGDGLARGRAHGEAARELVRAALDRWRAACRVRSEDLVTGTGLLRAIEKTTPDLVAELRGIAEGAGAAFADVVAYNLMDEQWWYERSGERGCSVLGVRRPGSVALAQNMDLPSFMDGSQLVLRLLPDDGPECLVLTSAGLIGLTGINRTGVAVCVNTLLMLRHNSSGLPVAAVLRGALAQPTRAGAVSFLRSVPHASGQHYAVADRFGMDSLECSARGVVANDVPVHTNHPLVSEDIDPVFAAALEREGRIADSVKRLAVLREGAGAVDPETLLADHSAPLCVTPVPGRATQTFGSVSFELGAEPHARFRLGLPGEGLWLEPGW